MISPEEKLMGPCLHRIQSATEAFVSLLMWYAPQRAFLTLESTQAHNRSGLSVFILKRKDLLEGDVCILYATIVHARH